MKQCTKWIFTASLALNILLSGFIMGRTPFPHGHGRPMHEAEMEGLPDAKREQFERIMESMHEKRKDDFEKIDNVRKQVVAILEAKNFDEKAFLTKSKELDGIFSDRKLQMIESMADLAKQCTQDERKILAEHLKRPPPSMGPPPGERP